MSTWERCPLLACVIKHGVTKNNQIKKSEIKPSGSFPVIDQGQSYIAGYSDDKSRLVTDDLPYVVFGDHTRCFKYVDFPFIVGADGTKVLKANPDIFHPKFFYYALLELDIPHRGYNRHFKLLCEKSVPRPERFEQRRIAAVLSTVQRAIEQQERLIALTTELKKALMHKLFTEGTRGEPQKDSQIGPIPESWEVTRLEDVVNAIQYGTSVKCDYDIKGYPTLRIPNVVGGDVDIEDLKYGNPKPNEVEQLKLRVGDLLFVRTNGVKENAGRCSIYKGELGDSCYYASYLIRVSVKSEILRPQFLAEYTRTNVGASFLSGRALRTADGKFNINSGTIRNVLVPKPTPQEQDEISEVLGAVDRTVASAHTRKSTLTDLFRTLLHQLITAQIRVYDINQEEVECQ